MSQSLALTRTDQARRSANAVRLGTVAEVDPATARVRVQSGDNLSAWLPWTTQRAGGDRSWSAPDVGEQVVVACPDGDLAAGVVLGALYQDASPAPADSIDVHRTTYQDGAVVEYDRGGHKLTATLPGGGTAQIDAPAGVTVNGNVTVNGILVVTQGIQAAGGAGSTLQVTGRIEATEDVIADADASAISLISHLHDGVTPGGGNTGVPI